MDFARPDAVEAFLHLNVFKELQETGVYGATVCIAKLGRYSFTLSNCYGFADAARGMVLDSRSSLFDLGGCAKVLAALALLQLLQESGLSVTTEVHSLLPPNIKIDTSQYGSVTVQQLLTHTSGLQRGGAEDGGRSGGTTVAAAGGASGAEGDGGGRGGAGNCENLAAESSASGRGGTTPVMSYLLAQQVYGARLPGAYRPQDVDYMLIGAIIEHMTGESYDSYVKDVLLDPLGVRLQPQPGESPTGGGGGCASADAEAGGEGSPGLFAYVSQQDLEQLRGGGAEAPSGLALCSGGAGAGASGAGAETLSSLEEEPGSAAAVEQKKVLVRYDPPALTPVGGLVLTAADIGRLLPLFLHNSAAAGEQDGAGSGGIGRSLLQNLYDIRLSDFIKDVGVAYGGLVSLGLSHSGDRVVSCESPPAPPSTRERVLTAQAAAQAAAQEARSHPAGEEAQDLASGGQQQQQPLADPRADSELDPEEDEMVPLHEGQEEGQGQQQGQPAAHDGGGGGGGAAGGGGGGEGAPYLGHPSLLLVAPEGGLAVVVSCNTAGPEGTTFCRNVASKLLARYRPAELQRSVVRSWLAAVPPPRQDAIVHLVAFPPACCVNPGTYFDGWPLSLPDYIKIHCMQAPGHGTRRHEPCEHRIAKLVGPATAALLAGLPADAPLALFGHGLGALWAFEVARRLESLFQRQPLHLFVCASAAPSCFPSRGGVTAGGATAGGDGSKRFETWGLPALQHGQQQQQQSPPQPMLDGQVVQPPAADPPEMYELPDEAFITACRNHPRFPRQLRHDIKAILDHLPLLRADIEAEMRYTFTPPAPSLCPSVAAVLASVQNRADEEATLSQGLLSCPITVLTPDGETALSPAHTAGWEQMTSGPVRFQSVAGDYHCLEERKTRGQVVAAITGGVGRQMSVHVPWLAKLRPERAGGRWAGSAAAGRAGGGSRPASAVGAGGGGGGAGATGPVLTLHLPPMYPRG